MKTAIQKLVITILIVSELFVASPVYAFNFHLPKLPNFPGFGPKNEVPKNIQNANHSASQVFSQDHKDTATPPAQLKPFKFWGFIAMASGKVTAKDGTSITIEKNGKSYMILTDDKTQFLRLYWGKSSYNEIQIGDNVNVFGNWTDATKTTILARSIRDVSIQKRFGVFFGVVQSLTSNGWVMTTITGARDNQTVTISLSTKLTNRKGDSITQAEVLVGHRVRVKGMWDRANNTVTEVTVVKDFSLPPFPAGTITPSVTATPTVTPTSTPVPTDTPTPTPTQ